MRVEHNSSIKELRKEHQIKSQELRELINNTQRSLALLNDNFSKISVGGITLQIFGVFLIIYGSITSYVT